MIPRRSKSPALATAVIGLLLLAGCVQPEPSEGNEESVEPTSWKKSCDFVLEGSLKMPCRFDESERLLVVPDTAVCTSELNVNGVHVRFLRDLLGGHDYLEYHALLEPISVVVAESSTEGPAVAVLTDSPMDGFIDLGPSTLDPHYFLGVYHDELFVGPDRVMSENGIQEFYRFGDEIYTIHRWVIENETRYIGETSPNLVPRGVESWQDLSGDVPAYISMRSFIVGDQIPAMDPGRCDVEPGIKGFVHEAK